ncbi:RNA methyltransferase [Candidatus Babeliales bacterium]|nr:RNA methyltransferase [Candidatus Babeliales bacterium]
MIITSVQNPKIKHVLQLQQKNYRYKQNEFMAQGFKTCFTLQQYGYKLKTIFMTETMYHQHQQDFLIDDVELISDQLMQTISTTSITTGIVGVFAMPSKEITAFAHSAIIYNLQDPGNVGTLIRTASAMGLQAVYLIDSVDIYNPKVVQATTGCFGALSCFQTTWDELKPIVSDIPLCALVVESGAKPEEIPLASAILVIGNEGQGLPADIIASCTYRMTLPMPGKTESLNAAVAGSIALYLKSRCL